MGDKKAIILIALFVVLGGIGVWQFTGGGPENTPRPKPPATKTDVTEIKPPIEQLSPAAMMSGPAKDPFVRPAGVQDPNGPGANIRVPGPSGVMPKPSTGGSKSSNRTEALGGPLPPLGTTNEGPKVDVKERLNGCGWEVTGIVMGPVPVAVLRNEAGEQVLAREGQQVDGNVRVGKISSRGVAVNDKSNGKTVKLAIGGGKVD